jgi:hypothetical protein
MPPVRDVGQMTAPRFVQDAPHGTVSGWKMGCRCTCCHAANDADQKTSTDQTAIPTPRRTDIPSRERLGT